MARATAPPFRSLAPDTRPEPRTAFEVALHRLLDDLFAAQPTWATQIGFHAHDDRWPDPTESGRASRLRMLRHHRAALAGLPADQLSPEETVDRGIVLEAIDELEFHEDVLRQDSWDPLQYVYQMGTGFFALLAREFAPWAHRGAAFLGRLQSLPSFVAGAAAALVGLPDRPVS
ncbi:MAG: DUF885 domain-containing protein, partial [Chloroflexota bacterium]|nr:DUF885 domain-containing protein [Chloroflexota bacterium]